MTGNMRNQAMSSGFFNFGRFLPITYAVTSTTTFTSNHIRVSVMTKGKHPKIVYIPTIAIVKWATVPFHNPHERPISTEESVKQIHSRHTSAAGY